MAGSATVNLLRARDLLSHLSLWTYLIFFFSLFQVDDPNVELKVRFVFFKTAEYPKCLAP